MKQNQNDISIIWEVDEQPELTEYIKRSFTATLAFENVPFAAEVETLIVSAESIREINREYRDIDKVTDVLSFPLYENAEEAAKEILPDGERICLGNMLICLDRAVEQAKEYGHSLEREICFLTVHSTLHLLGYDHELGEREETEMFQKQREILDTMGVTR